MRSKIEANEYKDFILGFIFYKFLSDKEVKFLKENGIQENQLPKVTEKQAGTVTLCFTTLGYFISYENLFSTWIAKDGAFNAADVTNALSDFRRLNATYKKRNTFDDIFDSLGSVLPKLATNQNESTKGIRDLLYLIKDIPMDGKQDYDVLGFIYEYLISNFAANAGKKAGEFYTPHEVSLLMSEIVANHLNNKAQIEIYDPTSGSGSLLINIGRCAARYMGENTNIKYYAQEIKQDTYNLTRMNLIMRGIDHDKIMTRNADTLENDWPMDNGFGGFTPLRVDAVVSNPPYSLKWNPEGKERDPRYRFGLAPKGKADYAFLLHDLYHLKPDGIMTIVLPHGVLFRGGEEGAIRKNLIESNHIDAIIGLPANIFFGTGIPTIIMVLKQDRRDSDVLIVDASKGFAKVGKNNVLRACDIKKIVDTVTTRVGMEKFSKVVSRDEIRANDYNLNIPRYVDSSEKTERWDIYASMFGGIPESELAELHEYWEAFPGLKASLFSSDTGVYHHPRVADFREAVFTHPDVVAFNRNYDTAFADFDSLLSAELLEGMSSLNLSKEESILSDAVFARLRGIPLVDKYAAYQLLDDVWKKIAVDLEIIQTEGFAAAKKVDPNWVVKKKDGKDHEVQEGWVGHVLPFELVQETLLADDLAALRAHETRLNEIYAEYDSLLDELSEEEKEQDFVSEDKDAFVPKDVTKTLKSGDAEPETLFILRRVASLLAEEKTLKKKAKDEGEKLHQSTRETIEKLDDAQTLHLLKLKWVTPLINSLSGLPSSILHDFIAKLTALCKKYETTFADVDRQIEDTEVSLISLLDELTGNEFDMLGINELRNILGGDRNDNN